MPSAVGKEVRAVAKTGETGRDAGTGRFIPIPEAKRRPKTTVIEKIKRGPTKKQKPKK